MAVLSLAHPQAPPQGHYHQHADQRPAPCLLVEQPFAVQLRRNAGTDDKGQQGNFPARPGHWANQIDQGGQYQRGTWEAAITWVEHQCQHHHRAREPGRRHQPTGAVLQPVEGTRAPTMASAQGQGGMGQHQQVQRHQQAGPYPLIIKACGHAGEFGPGADRAGRDAPQQRQQPGSAGAADAATEHQGTQQDKPAHAQP